MKKLWKDLHISGILLKLVYCIFFMFFIFLFIKNISSFNHFLHWFIFIGVFIIFLSFFTIFIFTKLSYVTDVGIRIGNAHNDIYTANPFKSKPEFFKWNKIKEINIVNKEVRHNFILVKKAFITLKTVDGKRHESFIAQPNKFIKTIKDLRKDVLLK